MAPAFALPSPQTRRSQQSSPLSHKINHTGRTEAGGSGGQTAMNRLHPLIRTQFARRWGYLLILREGNYSIFRDGETENCRTVRQRVQPLCFLERRMRVRVTVGSYQTVAMSQSFCRPRCRWIRHCSPPAVASKSPASAPNMAKSRERGHPRACTGWHTFPANSIS